MKQLFLVSVVALALLAAGASGAPPPSQAQPGRETVLALAHSAIKVSEPKLDFGAQKTVRAIRSHLAAGKRSKVNFAKAVDELVNQLTIALAGLRNFDALKVSAAELLIAAPENPRTANLFASVLHTSGAFAEAATVLEYLLARVPQNSLIALNLANVYVDLQRWDQARALAERVLKTDTENRAAHRVLAWYWYEKKNIPLFHTELAKAAQFKGFVKRKADKKRQPIEEELPRPGEPEDTAAQKLERLGEVVPLTTADIIEDQYPNQARQIRERYQKLPEARKIRMPALPMVNLMTPADYQRNLPIVEAWAAVFLARCESLQRSLGPATQSREAEDRRATKEWADTATATIQKAIDSPHTSPATRTKLLESLQHIEQAARRKGVAAPSTPEERAELAKPDTGSPLVELNYRDYSRIAVRYESFLNRKIVNLQFRSNEIRTIYTSKVREEDEHHKRMLAQIMGCSERLTGPFPSGPCTCDQNDFRCRKEVLRHKKQINELGRDYYAQWSTLYLPGYTRHLKPVLDAYWKVGMLYVRNMNDAEVMRREQRRIVANYTRLMLSSGMAIASGRDFRYLGTTAEEEAQLNADIARAERAAQEKKLEYHQAFREPDLDLEQWLKDHLVLSISGQFLSLSVTAKAIKFEAWLCGPGGSIEVNFEEQYLETRSTFGLPLKMGVKVGGLELGETEAKLEVFRAARWGFANGTYSESSGFRGEGSLELGIIKGTVELELNTELEARAGGRMTVGDDVALEVGWP